MQQHLGRALERAAALLAVLVLTLGAAFAPANAEVNPAAGDVTHMVVERSDEGVFLTASVRFDLPTVVEDALAKGIPMFFVAEAAIYRDRWYWADKRVANATRHMKLAFQPLTRRWRLQVSPSPIGNSGLVLGQMFDSREEALAAVQRVSRWKIAEAEAVDPDSPHTVDFRFRLDVSQLPRPFQIGAVGQNDWNVSASRALRLDRAR